MVGWEGLSRDLLVARRCTTDITIHSLEGCIAQDLLPRLESFDWTSPAPPVALSQVMGVAAIRAALCGVLAAGAHPVAATAVALVVAGRRTRRRATGRSLHGGF